MIQHPFAHFEGGLLFGVIFVSVLELHAYLSYKKIFLLGLIIPIGFFLFNVYHFWSNSLKETLYIIFYDTINLVPLFIILICEFIVFKIGGTLKRKKCKRI